MARREGDGTDRGDIAMGTRHDGTQAQGDAAGAQASGGRRIGIVTSCGACALVIGIAMFLVASSGAYVGADGILHEDFAALVGSKAFAGIGIALLTVSIAMRARRRRSGSGE